MGFKFLTIRTSTRTDRCIGLMLSTDPYMVLGFKVLGLGFTGRIGSFSIGGFWT